MLNLHCAPPQKTTTVPYLVRYLVSYLVRYLVSYLVSLVEMTKRDLSLEGRGKIYPTNVKGSKVV